MAQAMPYRQTFLRLANKVRDLTGTLYLLQETNTQAIVFGLSNF
jgi:hypothetical protein